MGDDVLIVGDTAPVTERELRAGRLACPDCGGSLRPWGTARPRTVRLGAAAHRTIRPRRTRCGDCGVTHVLLPNWTLLRRAYAAPVVWAALAAHAGGTGYRRVALRLRLPATTIRDWLRSFRRAEPWLRTRLGNPDGPTMRALERLSPPRPAWQFAVMITDGRLLNLFSNTSPPHAASAAPSARPP